MAGQGAGGDSGLFVLAVLLGATANAVKVLVRAWYGQGACLVRALVKVGLLTVRWCLFGAAVRALVRVLVRGAF